MIRLIFVICGILCNFTVFAQKNLDGIYYSSDESYIKIEKDSFWLIIPDMNIWHTEIMAKGTIKPVGKSFIEINTEDPHRDILTNMKIVQTIDSIVKDSIEVEFHIPLFDSEVIINLFTSFCEEDSPKYYHADMHKTFSISYSSCNQRIILPANVVTIRGFSIKPKNIIVHNLEGYFYGINYYYYRKAFYLQKDVNHIDIYLPTMDDAFFEKYYIIGDYAQIKGDCIIWKGTEYRKSK